MIEPILSKWEEHIDTYIKIAEDKVNEGVKYGTKKILTTAAEKIVDDKSQ